MSNTPESLLKSIYSFYITAPKPRPDFRTLIAYIWEEDHDVDSDGDSYDPASREWTELTLSSRQTDERVDIDPYQHDPLILVVRSLDKPLAACVAYLLAQYMQSQVVDIENGSYESPESFLSVVADDFDVNAALERFSNSRYM